MMCARDLFFSVENCVDDGEVIQACSIICNVKPQEQGFSVLFSHLLLWLLEEK